MNVVVNGTGVLLPEASTVADAIASYLPNDPRVQSGAGLAAAVNGHVVPHPVWADTAVHDGDSIDILTAFVGG